VVLSSLIVVKSTSHLQNFPSPANRNSVHLTTPHPLLWVCLKARLFMHIQSKAVLPAFRQRNLTQSRSKICNVRFVSGYFQFNSDGFVECQALGLAETPFLSLFSPHSLGTQTCIQPGNAREELSQ
jgi:hypothetical protein